MANTNNNTPSESDRSRWDEYLLLHDPGRERIIMVPAAGRPDKSIEMASSTMTPAMPKDYMMH